MAAGRQGRVDRHLPPVHRRKRPVAGIKEASDDIRPGEYQGPALWDTFCTVTPCKEVSLSLPLSVDPKRKLEDASSRLLSPFTTTRRRRRSTVSSPPYTEVRWDNGKVSVDGGRSQFTIDPATGRFTGVVEHKSAESKLPEGTEPTR